MGASARQPAFTVAAASPPCAPMPGISIVLEPPLADPNASPADRQVVAELMAKGQLRAVLFATSDCDALFERLNAAGGGTL